MENAVKKPLETPNLITALEAARRVRGESVTSLSKAVGIVPELVREILTGERRPAVGDLEWYSGILQIGAALEVPRPWGLSVQLRNDWIPFLASRGVLIPTESQTLISWWVRLQDLTQEEAAELCGVSRRALNVVISGKANAGGEVAVAISDSTGLPTGPLLRGTQQTQWPLSLIDLGAPYVPKQGRMRRTFRVSEETRAKAKNAARSAGFRSISKFVQQAILDWTEAREAQHGDPYPEKMVPTGRPFGIERDASHLLNLSLDVDPLTRYVNACAHAHEPLCYPAWAVENAVELWIKTHERVD